MCLIEITSEYPSSLGKFGETSGWKFLSIISSLLITSLNKTKTKIKPNKNARMLRLKMDNTQT